MAFLIIFLVLLGVVLVVTAPLRGMAPGTRRATGGGEQALSSRLVELEAAREAKYREIRDTQLDHDTGKLSDDDFTAVDGALRAEAATILHQLDAIRVDGEQDG